VSVFDFLVNDAALDGRASAVEAAVRRHLSHRGSSDLVRSLQVPDHRLGEIGRTVAPETVRAHVVNTTGAGGLVSLGGRTVHGVQVISAESGLRDLDDLVGNAVRVIAAAAELEDEVEVYVGLPPVPGWQRAAEAVEAAGLYGSLGTDPASDPSALGLAGQVSALVELDLPFAVAAADFRATPTVVDGVLRQHGVLNLLLAVDALIDEADLDRAACILMETDPTALASVFGWDDARAVRVRRRIRAVGVWDVTALTDELTSLESGRA
jgi:hypothetical protein